mgnify:CR=1 FL=1|jgi:hypothetical protein
MIETFEDFTAIYQFCDPASQNEETIIVLARDKLKEEFGEGEIKVSYWEGEEDSLRKTTPVGDSKAVAIINLTDSADYQGAEYVIEAWPEKARLGNFGDWVGDPNNKDHHPDWLNEEGALLMCKGDRAIGFRPVVSQTCRRILVELV